MHHSSIHPTSNPSSQPLSINRTNLRSTQLAIHESSVFQVSPASYQFAYIHSSINHPHIQALSFIHLSRYSSINYPSSPSSFKHATSHQFILTSGHPFVHQAVHRSNHLPIHRPIPHFRQLFIHLTVQPTIASSSHWNSHPSK